LLGSDLTLPPASQIGSRLTIIAKTLFFNYDLMQIITSLIVTNQGSVDVTYNLQGPVL
jgi:hypothetical protein